MKVLHVLASIGPLRGGPSFVLRSLTSGLAERGIETHVVTTDDNGPELLQVPFAVPIVERNVTYWYFPRQTQPYQFSLPMARWLWKNVGNFDLVHIHAVFTFPSTVAAWVSRAKNVPYIVRPLGILNRWGRQNSKRLAKKFSFWAIERSMLQHARFVHYTSEQEQIEAEQAGARSRSVIIANPTDLEASDLRAHAGKFRHLYPMLEGKKLFVFLSRVARKKGLDLLLPAFAEVHRTMPDTVLAIAGDGDADVMEDVKGLAKTLGVSDAVLWTGFLQGPDKVALLSDADVFVLPSYSENFGVAVVEALRFHVPVIVSDQVGIHHEISRYRAGLVVPCQTAALAEAMAKLLSQPDLRANMAANAGGLAEARFSRSSILDAVIATYRSIVGPSACPDCDRVLL